ncbi:MAG: hypothetical protein ACK5P7_04115 [Bdellovibrio sp.]|jgi:hypothetical protein
MDQIDAACEEKLTKAAIQEKQSHLFLDYHVTSTNEIVRGP